jgi:tetratricopeptide (TPR) repeat protein
VEYLQYTRDLLARKDFANARQQALDLLRLAPQNAEAEDLLRLIKEGQEQQQREQQISQLRARAEDALRRNEFAEALGIVEQGLQLEPTAAALLQLRDTIAAARERMAKYREALQRAESELKTGDLENARQSIDQATAIQPDDPQGKRLASQIRVRLEQQARERQLAERRKRLENDIAIVETAMADARALLAGDQIAEALQRLEGIKGQVSQLPPKWGEEVELLRKEILAQQERTKPPVPAPIDAPPIDSDVTRWGQTTDARPAFESSPTPPPEVANRFPSAFDEPDELHPLREQNVDLGQEESKSGALQSDRFRIEESFERKVERPKLPRAIPQTRSRSIIWFVLAALVLVGVLLSLFLYRSAPRPPVNLSVQTPATKYTYAEINAEPWATLKEITPSAGEAQSARGSKTPLRIKLPPGQYNIELEGPNHERQHTVLTVPQEGGGICFVVFKKPDLNRLVSRP